MGEAVEVVKALVSPAEKLIDNIAKGVGVLYAPRHVRKMAEAKAYEIQKISAAIQEVTDLPVSYDKGDVAIDSSDIEGLIQRANHRQSLQAARKQQNIECIVGKAYKMLEAAPMVEDTAIDEDWLYRFFDAAENVSSEDMQLIWAKILAGEAEMPGRFSLRTLEIVRNLSASEASVFQKILPLTLRISNEIGVVYSDDLLRKYGINYKDIVDLDDYGLINASVMLMQKEVSKEISVGYHTSSRIMILKGFEGKETELSFGFYKLTKSAEELAGILTYDLNEDYFDDVAEMLYDDASTKGFSISLHIVEKLNGDQISYSRTPYRTIPDKV